MKISIKNTGICNAQKIRIDRPQWGYTSYIPEVFAQLSYSDAGFMVKFTVMENEPLCNITENFGNIHFDSCVEVFANFAPNHSNRYMNIEVNAIGTVKAAIRTCREDYEYLVNDIESLEIKTEILNDLWSVEYKIPETLLKRLYPGFSMETCKYIEANIYKCGEKTEKEHYLALFDLDPNRPDFHNPECFRRIDLV